MALSLHLRPATANDAQALVAIEEASFSDAKWSADDFFRYDCLVAEVASAQGGPVVGFLVSRETFQGNTDTPPEREILNLAVATEFRRSGVAGRLIEHELGRSSSVFLEVRESNAGAIQLYRNTGFVEVYRRKDYYQDPGESAIVMRVK